MEIFYTFPQEWQLSSSEHPPLEEAVRRRRWNCDVSVRRASKRLWLQINWL